MFTRWNLNVTLMPCLLLGACDATETLTSESATPGTQNAALTAEGVAGPEEWTTRQTVTLRMSLERPDTPSELAVLLLVGDEIVEHSFLLPPFAIRDQSVEVVMPRLLDDIDHRIELRATYEDEVRVTRREVPAGFARSLPSAAPREREDAHIDRGANPVDKAEFLGLEVTP